MPKAVEVVAALIWRGDRFLACQRPAHKALHLAACGNGTDRAGRIPPHQTPVALLPHPQLGVPLPRGEIKTQYRKIPVDHIYTRCVFSHTVPSLIPVYTGHTGTHHHIRVCCKTSQTACISSYFRS